MPRTAVIEARKAKGLSQAKLAALIGAPPSFVARLELCYTDPTPVQRMSLAQALGIAPDMVDTNDPEVIAANRRDNGGIGRSSRRSSWRTWA